MDYVQQGSGHPLIIHGRSGSGKSALMAKILDELPDDTTVISRFIGATPFSTQLPSLLRSLCEQIHREFGFGELEEEWEAPATEEGEELPQNQYEVPLDPDELPEAFERFLGFVPQSQKLVIVLDALDQLSPENAAHVLNWFPSELPQNIRIVASVLEREDEAGACYRSAQRRLPEQALTELVELSVDEGADILDAWLEDAGRILQPDQRSDVLSKFQAAPEGHALFLQLAFEEARRWRSFDGLPTGADEVPGLNETVEGVIEDMLARLEKPANHGPVLTKWALGYLSASRNGLAEGEMLDVLSADERVMEDFRRRSPQSPDTDRLPPVVWSRLYFDLEPYQAERSADGTSLIDFYHRQPGEVVEKRYLDDEADRISAHRQLGEYFATQAPWIDADSRLSNLRRASEVAWQQTRARDWDGLEQTLTDLQTLEAKAEGRMVFDITADFAAARAAVPTGTAQSRHLRLLAAALGSDIQFIARRPTTLFQCLWNRCWWSDCDEAAKHYDPPEGGWGSQTAPWERPEPKLSTLLERWREEKEERQPGFMWLRSLRPPPQPLGGAQIMCLRGHEYGVNSVAFDPSGGRVGSRSGDKTVRIWDAESGECLEVIEGRGDVSAIACGADEFRWCALWRGQDTVIVDAASREEVAGWPIPLFDIITGSNGRTWAGGGHSYLAIIRLEGPLDNPYPRTVTAMRLWVFGSLDPTYAPWRLAKRCLRRLSLPVRVAPPGHWDDKLTGFCSWHGGRFEVSFLKPSRIRIMVVADEYPDRLHNTAPRRVYFQYAAAKKFPVKPCIVPGKPRQSPH